MTVICSYSFHSPASNTMIKPEQRSLRFLLGIALFPCARLRASQIKGLQDVFPDREDDENDPQSLNKSIKKTKYNATLTYRYAIYSQKTTNIGKLSSFNLMFSTSLSLNAADKVAT